MDRHTGPSKGPSPMRLHSSVESHIATELAILRGLKQRSKDQHRSQIFYRRMGEVCRLCQLLLEELPRQRERDVPDHKSQKRATRLISKLVDSLIRAVRSSQQILELHHFIPLQTMLIAIYARLFAISSHISQALGLDIDGRLEGKRRKPRTHPAERQSSTKSALTSFVEADTLGELIAREDISVGSPRMAMESNVDVTLARTTSAPTEQPPSPPVQRPNRASNRAKSAKPTAKKPKRNAMDDIFA